MRTRRPSDHLRVGIVTSWPLEPARGSGTARAVRGLARGLEALGHRVRIVAPAGGGDIRLVPRLLFNAALGPRPAAIRHLDLVVGIDFDGFLLRSAGRFVVSLKGVAADEARWEVGSPALRLRVAAFLEAANARRADRVVVPSAYAAEMARIRYGIPGERLAVVPEAVEPPRVGAEATTGALERHAHLTVLSVAHQYPRKRTDVLLRAVPALARRVPDVRVRIAGDGPELPRLRRLASSLGLGGRVTFLGRISDARLAEEYARAHCFCLPSEQEAFGIAVVEAMAAGLPVVVARAAALPEVVEHGVDGLLVEAGRPEAIADVLARLLDDPERATRMGRAGRRRAALRTPAEHARAFLRAAEGTAGETAPAGRIPAARKG